MAYNKLQEFTAKTDIKVFVEISSSEQKYHLDKLAYPENIIDTNWKGFYYLIKKGEKFYFNSTNNWDNFTCFLEVTNKDIHNRCMLYFKIWSGYPEKWIAENAE